MPTKTLSQKPRTQKRVVSVFHKNGVQSSDEHLEKANKAMTKAWTLISHRKNKRS